MKKTFLLIFMSITSISYSQFNTKDQINMTLEKSRLANNSSITRQLSITSNKLRKVMIKLKIKSNSSEKTKLSAFSLVDRKNKLRYRLVGYVGYKAFIGSPESIAFRKTEFYDKKGKPIQYGPRFDESEKDYFNSYNIKGYTNFEIPINFGTKSKPKNTIFYFGETRYKKFHAELFFALLANNTDLAYELFYKDEKIIDIKF